MIVLWVILGCIGLVLLLLLAAMIRTLLIPGKQSTYRPDPDPEEAEAFQKILMRYTYIATQYRRYHQCRIAYIHNYL